MASENSVQKKNNIKVIALAVLCIILIASLAVVIIAVYLPNQDQMTRKDDTINSLNQQIAVLELQLSQTANASTYATQIAYLNSQISDLNDQLSYLNDTLTYVYSDYADLQNIVHLSKSGILYDDTISQNAGTTTTLWNNQLDYAGYIAVQATATSNTTYSQVLFNYGEINFGFNQTLGIDGTALFPVLPGVVTVIIGNMDQTDINNATITATYIY